jgi:ribose transport system permease protein
MGVGGFALTARLESGQPNAGNLLELDAIAAVVIGGTSITGGRGSIMRTAVGALLIAILRNGLDLQGVGDDKKQIIIGLVLIAAASADFVRRRLGRRRARTEKLVTAKSATPQSVPAA